MAPLGIVFRWIASVPLFALCGLIGLTIGSTALQAMGASLPYSNMAGMICATICGALTGILTAPPQHRRLGTYLFAGAPIIWMSYSAVAHYLSGDIAVREHLALLDTIVGGVVIYAATGRAYPNRNRVDDRHAETTRMIIRWVVATLLSVLGFSLTLILAVLSTHWFDSGHLEIFGGAYFSTSVGVMIGIQTVPPRHRAPGTGFLGVCDGRPVVYRDHHHPWGR